MEHVPIGLGKNQLILVFLFQALAVPRPKNGIRGQTRIIARRTLRIGPPVVIGFRFALEKIRADDFQIRIAKGFQKRNDAGRLKGGRSVENIAAVVADSRFDLAQRAGAQGEPAVQFRLIGGGFERQLVLLLMPKQFALGIAVEDDD